ncbi:MAG TPA: efflux transporter outer membrane subunit, partial [Bryobacteraceae bacterium]|nr:efflux transporter outer membrane subunit [Bryobacteraceae bacterium]
NDPQLNELEEQVAVSNQNVQVAEAQFRQARAAIQVARANLYPTIGVSPNIAAVRTPSNFAGGGQVASTSGIRGSYNLPFSLSYEPDIWGSIHRAIASNTALAQVSAADLANVKLLFQAELALNYFQVHGIDGDRELLTATVGSYQEYLDLTRNRYASGVASLADVSQAETQLETVRAQLVDTGVLRAQYEHAIAMLIGKPPSGFSIPSAPIKITPPPVPVTVPSALLERRPDIAATERQVAAANEQIGIAQAAYYPTLTLSAAGGSETSHFLQFLTWPSRFWSVGPTLAQTLFEGGRRRGQVNAAEANYDATVAGYRQTVLTAFQQVEDNLAALRILAEEAEVQARAVAAAQQSLTISTAQYKGGVVSYLQVITAQTTALENQRTALDILTRRMVASVSLIQALGGGWDASQLPQAKDLMAKGK